MNVFDEKNCSVIATQVVEGPAISSYGVLKTKEVAGTGGKLHEVLDLVEKPKLEDAPSNLAVIGRYILTPTIFETLSDLKPGAGASCNSRTGCAACCNAKRCTPTSTRDAATIPETNSVSSSDG